MKYGKENFDFEILGKYSNYNEMEKEFIIYYNTRSPNGYNIAEGGENPPVKRGEENSASKLTDELVWNVQYALLDERIPRKIIRKEYGITEDEIRHIIAGDCWRRDIFTYPLRRKEKDIVKDRVEEIIYLLITTDMSMKEIAEEVAWTYSGIKAINNGQNHRHPDLLYPINKNKEYNLSSKTCKDYPGLDRE